MIDRHGEQLNYSNCIAPLNNLDMFIKTENHDVKICEIVGRTTSHDTQDKHGQCQIIPYKIH